MRRLLKIVAIFVGSLVVLVALALLALTLFVNPNNFKPQIQKLAHDNANLAVDMKGNLGWTFWPSLGVSIGATDVRVGDSKDLFAAIQSAKVSVAVMPLLHGSVHVDGLDIDGLQLHLVKNKDGANWAQIGSNTPPTTPAAPTTTDKSQQPLDIPVTIPSVKISNAAVTYDDNTGTTHITLSQINLDASNVNLKESTPFPLALSLRYQDTSYRVDLKFNSQISLDLPNSHYQLAPMALDADVAGATPKPVTVHLEQNVDANLKTGVVALTNLALKAATVSVNGNVTIAGLTDNQLMLSGNIKVPTFNANQALQSIGMATVKTSDPKALSQISVDATLLGPANSVMVDPLVVHLDQSTLKGSAGLANLTTSQIVFNLALDKITLDGYLPPASKAAAPAASTAAATGGTAQVTENAVRPLSDKPLLPLDTLRKLNVNGKFTLGEMHYSGIDGKQLATSLTAAGGKLTTTASGTLMSGTFNLGGLLDASGKQPQMSGQGKVTGMQIQPAAKLALGSDLVMGALSATFNGSANGNTQQALMNSATGKFSADLKDGTVRGANLHTALVAGINSMLGKYQGLAALFPTLTSNPAVLSKDTKIVDLTASGSLAKQIAQIDQVKTTLEKGNLNGTGWFNINNEDFQFILGMQSPDISNSPYLKNTNWPIRCAGNLKGDAKHWCGPDRDGLNTIAKQAMTKAAGGALAEKLGIKANGDTPQEVIKNAAKDKAKGELQNQLNRLFQR